MNLANNDLVIKLQNIDILTENSSANFYCKDKKGNYLCVNKKFLITSRIDHEDDVVGKGDKDLPWRDQASILMKNDLEVIHTQQCKNLIEAVLSPEGEVRHYSSVKAPLYDNNSKVIGVMGVSNLIQKSYNQPTKLSKRQLECLYYLVIGKSMKQIAAALNLSPKTVEHYLNAVKFKLKCFTRAELVVKALNIKEIKERLC